MKTSIPKRILSLVLYLSLAVLVAYVLVNKHVPTLKLGAKAPIEDSIRLQNGATSFARLIKRTTVINFWASWCPPCLSELPLLAHMAQKYPQASFIGPLINSPQNLSELKSTYAIPYTIGHVSEQVSNNWQAQFLPTTYILNKQGQILWSKAGVLEEAEFENALEAALQSESRKP